MILKFVMENPFLKGLGIVINDILELYTFGESIESIIQEYPSLTGDMMREALLFYIK